MERTVGVVITALTVVLALQGAIAEPVTDGGYNADVQQCFDLQSEFRDANLPSGLFDALDVLCVDFRLDSCNSVLHANITYGSTTWINQDIEEGGKYEQCGDTDSIGCRTCYGLKNITVSPSRATVCPYVEERCPIFDPDLTLACYSLGSGCGGNSCRSCMAGNSNCGWCEETKQCLETGREGPYCNSCNGPQWWTDLLQCPAIASTSEGSDDGGMSTQTVVSLAVSLPLIGIVLIAIAFAVFKGKLNRHRNREHVRLMQVEHEERESVSGLDRNEMMGSTDGTDSTDAGVNYMPPLDADEVSVSEAPEDRHSASVTEPQPNTTASEAAV